MATLAEQLEGLQCPCCGHVNTYVGRGIEHPKKSSQDTVTVTVTADLCTNCGEQALDSAAAEKSRMPCTSSRLALPPTWYTWAKHTNIRNEHLPALCDLNAAANRLGLCTIPPSFAPLSPFTGRGIIPSTVSVYRTLNTNLLLLVTDGILLAPPVRAVETMIRLGQRPIRSHRMTTPTGSGDPIHPLEL